MNNSDITNLGALVSRVVVLEERVDRLEKLDKQDQLERSDRLETSAAGAAAKAESMPASTPALRPLNQQDQLVSNAKAGKEAELPLEAKPVTGVEALLDASPGTESSPVMQTESGLEAAALFDCQPPDSIFEGSQSASKSGSQSNSRSSTVDSQRSSAGDIGDDSVKGAPASNDSSSPDSRDNLKPAQSLEARIGLYWLSKLGIGFLVVGVALLIMYSFNYFGPAAKIATGFIVAAALMALGEYLEKRDNIPWYARLLEGGAWALGFFTTYAMHHVESVRIIQDPLTDLILMLGVAGLAVAHSVSKRSEMMAIFSVTLGFLTLALSHVSGFSAVASAILVVLAALLSIRQKWYQLYLYSIFASYGALMACGSLQSTTLISGVAKETFQLASMLLGPSLIGFGLVPIYMSEQTKLSQQTIVIGTIVNASAFCALFFPLAYGYLGPSASVYNLTVGLWFFALAILAKRFGKSPDASAAATINSLFGLTIATLYFSGAHCGRGAWIFLAAELAILSWSGLAYQLKSFRWFAIALGVVLLFGNFILMTKSDTTVILGHDLPFSLCASLCAILAMGVSAYMQKKSSLQNGASEAERKFAFYANWNMALMIAWSLPLALITVTYDQIGRLPDALRSPVCLFSWCGIAAAVLAMAVRLCSPYMQIVTLLLFATAGLPACVTWQFSWVNSTLVVAIMFAAAFVFWHYAGRLSATKSMANFRAQFSIAYCCAALLPAAAQWTSEPISVYLAIQALLALVVGMALKDKFVRLLAPVAFGFAAIYMSMNALQWAFAVPVVACLYLAWALYLVPGDHGIDKGESEIRHFYSIAAAIILTRLLGLKLEKTWISCAWALEGMAMLALGFVLREKVLRVTGLCVFASLVCRLLFIDLAGAETIYRIFAFIVAGLVLLLSAYAYTWFAKRFGTVGDEAKGQGQTVSGE